MKRLISLIIMAFSLVCSSHAAVDTLKGTSDFDDAIMYSWSDCNAEETGENCLRYNGGTVVNMGVGNGSSLQERRVVMSLPGWNGTVPDSSELKVYCYTQSSILSRKLILYPLTASFLEGDESSYGIGDYPNPDSGVTWNHRWLDTGDADSLNWTNPGSDYLTGVSCTTTVNGTYQYFSFKKFNRILNYWDTSNANYGFLVKNENLTPPNLSCKVIKSSEAGVGYYPLLILYTTDTTGTLQSVRRRRLLKADVSVVH